MGVHRTFKLARSNSLVVYSIIREIKKLKEKKVCKNAKKYKHKHMMDQNCPDTCSCAVLISIMILSSISRDA